MLRKVLYSVSIPLLTRFVYIALDDHCGQRGRCWYKQSTLSVKTGISVRHIRRSLRELELRGLLRVERDPRYLVYVLTWSDRTPVSADRSDTQVRSLRTPVSDHETPVLMYDPQYLIRGENSDLEGEYPVGRASDPQRPRSVACTLCGDSGVSGGTLGKDLAICECAAGDAIRRSA